MAGPSREEIAALIAVSPGALLNAFTAEVQSQRVEPQPPQETPTIFDPPTLKDYIGQDRAKELCRVMIGSAKKEKRALPNILLDGDAGLGKTTLAKLIYKEFRADYKITDGSSGNKMNLREYRGYLILDEIHNLEPVMCDSLNVLLDRGDVHIIGATTELGKLPKPFRSRFRQIHLYNYTDEQIEDILRRVAIRRKIRVHKPELYEIAKRSRQTPRIALTYLAQVFEVAVMKDETVVSPETIVEVFEMLGVDDIGLTLRDHDYLAALPDDGRAVGLQYISARISVDEKTIEEEVEPYLMKLGKIDRGKQGRKKLTIVEANLEEILLDSIEQILGEKRA